MKKYPYQYKNDTVGLLYASRNKRLAKKALKKAKVFFKAHAMVSYSGGPRVFNVNGVWHVWDDGYGPGYGFDPVKL